MNRLRNRLILVFALGTLVPLAATLWITNQLLQRSFSYSATRELDQLSKSFELTGRALYQNARDMLRAEVRAGLPPANVWDASNRPRWPEAVREFSQSEDSQAFHLAGEKQERLELYVRRGDSIAVHAKPVGGPGMKVLANEYARARKVVYNSTARDLRRGFLYTMLTVVGGVWIACFIALTIWARRLSRPMEELTRGLSELASGNMGVRLNPRGRQDEVGDAMSAFNNTAAELQQSQERLIHVTRLTSWQTLARKMAHEVKNSLTPIRLTMEELVARKNDRDDRFMDQAAQIVVDEVASLERRVRAFSDFASEPPVRLETVDINEIVQERIALLRSANPGVVYSTELAPAGAVAKADGDLVKGMLTNLLENAAQAAGSGGVVLGRTTVQNGKVLVEVHDSGPGLSAHARSTLFEPTITFKKAGMGLGLSIAKRSAVLLGGDILLVDSDLGGAAFRLLLPRAEADVH